MWVLLLWAWGAEAPEIVAAHSSLAKCENHREFLRQYRQSIPKRYACFQVI